MNGNGSATNGTAVFWDFENTYYNLRNEFGVRQTKETAVEAVKALRLAMEGQATPTWQTLQAYADFEALPERCGGDLTRIGMETMNVAGASRKNAADMKLAIDATRMLYTQSYDTFVIIGGDRDYLPLVGELKRSGRNVFVASFANSLSADLKAFIGEGNVVDLGEFLDLPKPVTVEPERKATSRATTRVTPSSVGARPTYSVGRPVVRPVGLPASGLVGSASSPRVTPATTVAMNPKDLDAVAVQLLTYIVDEYSLPYGWNDVWMGPLLRNFCKENPGFDSDRFSRTLDRLSEMGAVSVVNRPDTRGGRAGGYMVVVVHKNDPLVQEVVGRLMSGDVMSIAS